MSKTYVRGGTPVGAASRCKTCTSAHIMTGYRESELLAMCTNVQPNIVVPFNIYECTGYYDKNRPSWAEMQELAIEVAPRPRHTVGFEIGAGFQKASRRHIRSESDEGD